MYRLIRNNFWAQIFHNQVEKTYPLFDYEINLLTLESPKIQIISLCMFFEILFFIPE